LVKHSLLAFLGTFLFALKSIFIKLAYFEGLNSDVVLMLRMAIALPIYLGILSYILEALIAIAVNKTEPMLLIIFLLDNT
jgi:hypothetical protein